jgi:hypothetical protein
VPTRANAEGLTTAPDVAHTQAQLTGKVTASPGARCTAKDPRSPETALSKPRPWLTSTLRPQLGRLALDLEQVELARRWLAEADDPANADWRMVSARGTVLAHPGRISRGDPA